MSSIQDLAAAVASLIAHPGVEKHIVEKFNGLRWFKNAGTEDVDYNKKYVLVQTLAKVTLSTADGQPDYASHKLLADSGYHVVRGVYNFRGWLTGVICTPMGRIAYGTMDRIAYG
jgi:hypothetical protein